MLLNVMLAALAGAALGIGVALLREKSDQRIRTDADLGHLAGVPVLARILSVTNQTKGKSQAPPSLPRFEPWPR